MERNTFFCNLGLYIKSVLVFILLLGGSGSAWAEKDLPYSYGFENNDLAGEGWTKSFENSGIYNSQSYPGYNNSNYAFRFYGTENLQYLISPLLESSETGIVVSFYYNSFSSTQSRTFNVGYSTTNNDINSFNWLENDISYTENGWRHFTESFPVNVKYIAIRHKANSQYQPFFIDNFEVDFDEPYKSPKNLSLSTSTSSTATLTWTPGRNETAWQIAYSTKEDFNPATEGVKIAVTENPYTLSGLTDGVTYYAYVRSNYSGNYSAWSNAKLDFKPKTDISLCSDYNNKTSANVAVPNYTANSSYLTKSQMIYPYSDVSTFAGKYITQLTFYANTSSIDWGTATYDVYLAETSTSAFNYSATFIDWSNCTKVVEGTKLKVSDGKLVIKLTTPFLYKGADSKNLLIGFQQTAVSATAVSSTWYAKNITSSYPSASYYNSGSYTYTTGQSYLPYLTIEYISSTVPITLGTNGYTTFACPRPLDLTTSNMPDGLTAYRAAEVDAANNKVRFTSDINQTVEANTGVLLRGKASTTYDIPVAVSGTALEDNDFLVNSTGGTFTGDGDYTYFAMKKNSNPLTFGTFVPSSTAIPSNKAYLKVLTSSFPSGARTLRFVFDDNETTGIKNVDAQKTSSKDIYFNLNGQRVAKPTKGMYISNGKKYIVK